ncbi:MAG: adenosylhopane nucleosidase [Pseudolabrys sp.]
MQQTSTADSWVSPLAAAPTLQYATRTATNEIIEFAQPARSTVKHAPADHSVIALVGLAFEGRIASGPGAVVICRNTMREAASSINQALQKGCRRIISFGVAGGLAPHLRPGNWVVASSIIDAQQSLPTDRVWSEKILATIPGAEHRPIVGVDYAVATPEAKRRMHVETGAAAVDMESHLVARLASTHGLSFTAIRVVIDPAHRMLSGAALAGMRPDGGTNILAVVRELIAGPSQLCGLLRVACDAYAARRGLLRARRLLGPDFGLLGLSET